MRLHGFSHSSSTWRVRIALALKGLEVENVIVNVRRGADQQSAKEFDLLNVARQIPVLEWQHEGERRVLSQSMAILQYLEALRPSPPLWPNDAYEAAAAMQLAELVNAGIQPLQNNHVLGKLDGLGVESRDWAHDMIQRGLTALEVSAQRMTHSDFLVGSSPTVADLFTVPQLYNARKFGVDLHGLETLIRCETRCLSMPAFAETHPDR